VIENVGNWGPHDEKDREQALKGSEAQKRAVFEGALDAVISMDHEGRVLEFNPAAEKMFGKPRYEVIGQLLAKSILAVSAREARYQKLHQYLATNSGEILDERQEIAGLRSDESEFPLEVAYCRVPVSGQPIFTVYGRDRRKEPSSLVEGAEARLRRLRATSPVADSASDDRCQTTVLPRQPAPTFQLNRTRDSSTTALSIPRESDRRCATPSPLHHGE